MSLINYIRINPYSGEIVVNPQALAGSLNGSVVSYEVKIYAEDHSGYETPR